MPKREDRWDRNVRRFWSVAAPACGIGLVVLFKDVSPPAYWITPPVLALLAWPVAQRADEKVRERLDRKSTDA